jgi:hypothetical protein
VATDPPARAALRQLPEKDPDMMNQTSKSLRAGAGTYADDADSAAARALDSTREFAGQAIEKAGEKVRDLGYGVKDLANRGVSTVGDATSR